MTRHDGTCGLRHRLRDGLPAFLRRNRSGRNGRPVYEALLQTDERVLAENGVTKADIVVAFEYGR